MARVLLIHLAGLALLPACLEAPPYAGTHYLCDTGQSCPLDQRCVSGLCIDPPTVIDDTLLEFPPGPFYMGCDDTMPSCQADARPKHLVTLSRFRIERFEVTSGQFASCTTCDRTGFTPDPDPDLAVHGLNWIQASSYCLSIHRRLPTEAEWERAAHTVDGGYPWGSQLDCMHVNSEGCGGEEPAPYDPLGDTRDGMHAMAGNVREWVMDLYDAGYYATQLNDPRDPRGPGDPSEPGGEHVIRGGGYAKPEDDGMDKKGAANDPLVVWFRERSDPMHPADAETAKDNDFGVRCVLPVP